MSRIRNSHHLRHPPNEFRIRKDTSQIYVSSVVSDLKFVPEPAANEATNFKSTTLVERRDRGDLDPEVGVGEARLDGGARGQVRRIRPGVVASAGEYLWRVRIPPRRCITNKQLQQWNSPFLGVESNGTYSRCRPAA